MFTSMIYFVKWLIKEYNVLKYIYNTNLTYTLYYIQWHRVIF